MTATDFRATSPYARPEAPVREKQRPENRLGRVAAWSGGIALGCAVIPPLRWATIAFATAALVMGIIALGPTRRQTGRGGIAGIAIVLAVLSFVGMVASQAAFSAVGGGSKAAPIGTPVPLAVAQAQTTETVLATQAKVEIGKVSQELDSSGVMRTSLSVTVTNISKGTLSYDFEFTALDKKGRPISGGVDTAYIPTLDPGQSATVKVFNILNDTLSAELLKATFQTTKASSY